MYRFYIKEASDRLVYSLYRMAIYSPPTKEREYILSIIYLPSKSHDISLPFLRKLEGRKNKTKRASLKESLQLKKISLIILSH